MQNSSEKIKIIFCGMPDMANVCLYTLIEKGFEIAAVIPPPNSNPTAKSFIDYAKSFNLEVFEYDGDPDTPEMIEKIKAKKADIGVICSFNKLLKKDFLNTAKSGYINCHPSLLPMYRGANPYFHIINNGEKMTGVTLHFANESFDSGDIICQKGFPLDEKETIGTLFNRSNFMIADMLCEVLEKFQNTGKIDSKPQESGDFTKAPRIPDTTKLDLNKKCREIERLVRASNPFYTVYLNFRGAPVKIFCADFEEEKHCLTSGIITAVKDNRIKITASDGYIYPKCLQCGTWGIFDAENFIRVFKPQTGENFN